MYSAGILLYKNIGNTIHLLLGKDIKYNLWSDMGGRSEEYDRGDKINTACREFYEESMGIISDEHELRYNLKHNSIRLDCDTYNNNAYFMYMLNAVHVVHKDNVIADFYYQQIMLGKTRFLSKFKEKYQLAWFSINYVLENPSLFREVFYRGLIRHIHTINKCVIV